MNLERLRSALAHTDQVLGPTQPAGEASAWIAIPIPPRAQWRLLRDPADVPPGFMIVGSLLLEG